MAAGKCHLEIHVDGRWHVAAEVRVDDPAVGIGGPARVEYDFEYLDAMRAALGVRDHRAISCRYPLGYQLENERSWPAFLLDVIPSGAARKFWERELRVPNNSTSDWAVLVGGGGNPPGNLRVAEAAATMPTPSKDHPGFSREAVLSRADHFIEYAREQGASVAGGSGAGGDSQKFLLREDERGRWHADGALEDRRTARAWLVKFPRSSTRADRLVLKAEAGYHRVARALGARTFGDVAWERDCLFVPRFDCFVSSRGSKLVRHGFESLCSLAGVSEFGTPIAKEKLIGSFARYCTHPGDELREFVLRDVLDVALGNTDNHARNSAVLKRIDSRIELSPIYDFAPMMLDPQGIARVCRWSRETSGFPDWGHVADAVGEHDVDVGEFKAWLRSLAPRVRALPRSMTKAAVPASVIDSMRERIKRVASDLEEVP